MPGRFTHLLNINIYLCPICFLFVINLCTLLKFMQFTCFARISQTPAEGNHPIPPCQRGKPPNNPNAPPRHRQGRRSPPQRVAVPPPTGATRRPSNPPRPRGVSARMGDTVVKSAAELRHRQGSVAHTAASAVPARRPPSAGSPRCRLSHEPPAAEFPLRRDFRQQGKFRRFASSVN